MRCLLLAVLASVAVVKADDLINEFNNPGMGIAFSMIPLNVWEGRGGGNNGMDAAGFYSLSSMGQFHSRHQQAISIMTRNQDMNPYPAYGNYGIVFHVTEQKQFWKYFQVAGYGKNVLVAGPRDGANHIPGTADWRKSIYAEGKSYAWFAQQKNAVLAQYGAGHNYNEFDTNGLSPEGLAGAFVNEQCCNPPKPAPSHAVMCGFLKRANPSRTQWPLYGYKWHSLYIKETLNCGGGPAPRPPPTPTGRCAVSARKDCGFNGITQAQCKAKGCCWAPGNGPWCFHANGDSALLNATKPVLV